MRRLKDNGIFHAHAHQIRDREKPAVIDGFIQVLPERQLVILFGQQALSS